MIPYLTAHIPSLKVINYTDHTVSLEITCPRFCSMHVTMDISPQTTCTLPTNHYCGQYCGPMQIVRDDLLINYKSKVHDGHLNSSIMGQILVIDHNDIYLVINPIFDTPFVRNTIIIAKVAFLGFLGLLFGIMMYGVYTGDF